MGGLRDRHPPPRVAGHLDCGFSFSSLPNPQDARLFRDKLSQSHTPPSLPIPPGTPVLGVGEARRAPSASAGSVFPCPRPFSPTRAFAPAQTALRLRSPPTSSHALRPLGAWAGGGGTGCRWVRVHVGGSVQSFLKGSCQDLKGELNHWRWRRRSCRVGREEGGMSLPGSALTHPHCSVPTPRQSALSRALLQPNAWAAASVVRVADSISFSQPGQTRRVWRVAEL